MFAKILAALLGLALLAGGVQTLRLKEAANRAEKAAQKADEYQRSLEDQTAANAVLRSSIAATEKADARKAATLRAIITQEQTKNAELQEALKANRDWADVPIPDSVLDALRD